MLRLTKHNAILAITALNFFALGAFAEQMNIAFVDMEVLFQHYYKTATADETIRKQTEIFKEYAVNLNKEKDTLEGDFNTLRDESQNIAISDELRDEKRNQAQTKFMLLQEKKKEIHEYQQNKRQDLRKQYEEQRNKLVKEIIEVINGFGQQENHDLILDSSGNTLNGLPVFIFYRPEWDITESILALINKGHEDEGTKPDEAGDDDEEE